MRLADAARDAGDAVTAATLYEAITSDFPERRASWVQLGNMAKDSNDFARAEKSYLHALSLDRGDADVPLQLGHLFKLQGHFDEALSWYDKALSLDSSSPAAHELQALGFRRRILDLRGVGEDPHKLDLPGRAIQAYRHLVVSFANRRN